MFNLSAKEFSEKYYCEEREQQSNSYFRLNCESGEGLINPLLKELYKKSIDEEQRKKEFEFYLEFFLKKCININRSFSDAVEFLSLWLELSPDTLLEALETAELKPYFYRTEYGHDGDQWPFPRLLQVFSILVKKELVTAKEILAYLFETFDFFNMPEEFVSQVIGYGQLESCFNEIPQVFKTDLLLKINEFIQIDSTIYLGLRSHQYLNTELQNINPTLWVKKADPLKLAFDIKTTLFKFPSHMQFDPQVIQPNNFGKRTYY